MVKETAFSIIADTANCGETSCLLMSITITHESQIIRLGKNGRVNLDDAEEQLPLEVHGIYITLNPESHVLAKLPDGFSVIWDGQHKAIVSAPASYRTNGLCGNNDGNPDNDMQNPNGEMCNSVQEFIASWEVKPELKNCTVYGDPTYQTFDGYLYISVGRFEGRKRRAEIENAGHSYILVKENAFSIIADTANCGKPSCLLMSITLTHGSQIIRLGQNGRVSLDDVDKQLPLEVHGIYIALTQESHVLAELPDRVSVIWDGQHRAIVSAPSTHRTKGLCGNNDGNPDNDMQNPDGEMCDSVQEFIASWEVKPELKSCTVYGDPTYWTFDGRLYISGGGFGGRKRRAEIENAGHSYILVKENAFSIIADTANCGEPSCLLMSITITHESRIIRLGQNERVSLDDVDKQLPLEVHGMHIALTQESHVLAELPNGVSVIWDGQHRAIVSAPSTHRTKGLCGNNDGNPDNDMQNQDGEICDSVQEFIASWEFKLETQRDSDTSTSTVSSYSSTSTVTADNYYYDTDSNKN